MLLVQFVCNQCQGTVTACIHYDVSLPQRIFSPLLRILANECATLRLHIQIPLTVYVGLTLCRTHVATAIKLRVPLRVL